MILLKFTRLFSLFTILSILSYSCSDANKTDSDQTISGMTKEARYNEEEEHEAYVVKIDLNDSLQIVNSLLFTKEDGSQIDVTGFLNEKGEVVKLIEKFVDSFICLFVYLFIHLFILCVCVVCVVFMKVK